MTAPLDPKNDWVEKDTPGHVEADWRLKATDVNLLADNVIWTKDNLGGGSGGGANLSTNRTSTQVMVQSDSGTDATIPAADASNAGVMTAAQQNKLGAIEPLADVTDAANVNAAGAVMNSDTTTAAMAFVVDEDAMTSNSATKVPTQQSVKAYVDAVGGGGGGSGDVVGPGSATDNAIARFDTTTGKLLQTSAAAVDDNGIVTALNAFLGFATTATAAGTTLLTVSSARTQEFTGTTTQTVRLPTTSVPQGAAWRVVNNSTGNVTVQSSGSNTILVMGPGTSTEFVAEVATPTTAANWSAATALPAPGTSGNVLTSNGSTWQSAAPPTGTLPSQTGHGGQFLTTDGTTPSWVASVGGTGMMLVASPTGVAATDTAAIQAAHNALPATGGIILLAPGYYSLTATGVTVTKPIILQGQGTGNGVGSGGTVLVSNSASAVGITLSGSAAGSVLRDFALVNQTTPTSGVGILASAADICVFERLYVMRYYDGISITSGLSWTIHTCVINSPRRYGIRVQNTTNPDFGDSAIYNTKFLMDSAVPVADPDAAIRWETGGGFRVSGCKVNWASPTSFRYSIGVDIAFTGTVASTADIFIHDNSFENIRTTGVKLSRTAGTFGVTGVLLRGNELMNMPTGFDCGVGFAQVVIAENVGIGAVTGISVNASANPVLLGINSWSGATTEVTGPVITGAAGYAPGGADVALADGGTGASLTPPVADAMMFYDVSAAATRYLTPGTNLAITGTTLNASGGGAPATELAHNFIDDANGTPVTADTGQTWSLTNNRAPNMTVVSGRLVDTDTATGLSAKYCSAILTGTAGYIKATFNFGASGATNGHVACIAAWVTPLTSGAGGVVPDGPLHVTATNTEVSIGVWEDEILTILDSWTYPALGTATFTIEAVIDKASSTVVVRGPDGKLSAALFDARIGTYTAPYVTVESFRTAANTDKQVQIQNFSAHIWPPPPQGQSMYDVAVNAGGGGGGLGPDTVGWTELDASGTPSATTYLKVDAAGALSADTPPSGGTPADGSITYPKLASSGTGGTNKYLNVSAGGVMSLTTPSATATPGGMSSGWINVVTDFGADPTGVTDSGPAFRNAANYANASFDRPIWVPAGAYTYNGAGMSGTHLHIEGPGVHQCSITLGAGTYFVDSGLNFYSFWLSGIHFKNGAGHVRHTSLVNNVHWNKVIQDCFFENYTNCSIQNNSNVNYADGDNPDWHITRCFWQGANFTTTMGIALKGLTDTCTIDDCEFQKNRVHIKIDRGNNAHIWRNAFLRFGGSEGSPRCDVWIVPVDPALDADPFYAARAPGDGMTITGNKFGSEFIESGDKRIVIAQQSATGTWWGDKFPILTSNSSYILNGVTIDKNNYAPQTSFIYSTTPNLTGMCFGPNTIMWPGGFAPALTLRTATGFNHALNIVGPVMSNSINQLSPPSLVTAESGTLSGQPRSL